MNLSLAFNRLLDFTVSQKSNNSYSLVFDNIDNYTNHILTDKKKRSIQNETLIANDIILKEPSHSYVILISFIFLAIGIGLVVRLIISTTN